MAIKNSILLALLVPLFLSAQDNRAISGFETLIRAEKFAEARPVLEAYVATHPQAWQPFYQLGYTTFRLHVMQESVAMLCKSLVLNPNFAESHKILAYDLNILGRQDLAIRELERAIRFDPRSAESHYEIGRIYYEQGSYLKAIHHLEQAKSLNPANVRVYHNLGLAYSAVADDAKAVTNFELGLQLNAQQSKLSAWPLIDYATYLNLKGEYANARGMLLRAIQIDNTLDQAFEELSKAYRAMGQTGDAVQALKQAIEINPQKAEYHYVLARMYTQGRQLNEAKEQMAEYERAKSPGPK